MYNKQCVTKCLERIQNARKQGQLAWVCKPCFENIESIERITISSIFEKYYNAKQIINSREDQYGMPKT